MFAVVAAGGAAACEPGGISSATVAYTTDETVTRELDRQKADVRWLTCTASYGDSGKGGKPSPSASEKTVATVDCDGETKDGKDITVTGKVTHAVDGACVRGNITAKVDGKVWFQVDGLGDCGATPSPVGGGPANGRPGPTVTVTVTQTIWCDRYPDCRPVEGK
ncbi:lipoprotein [Streptomyces djakartensis]|uniref:Lipoprotein n=1 Tax=Streptomyces djakartensis TaxID=68193 RepID=A0ABQ2ZFB5_9ACTN|nr:lipoprotein [Streptomyces djakartensis]